MTKLKVLALLFCLMVIATIIGCSDTSNLISPNQIDTILDTCDTDIDISIEDGKYIAKLEIDKDCANNILLVDNEANIETPAQSTDFILATTIANDVSINGENSKYNGQTLTIRGITQFVLSEPDKWQAIILKTNNDVDFYIWEYNSNKYNLASLKEDKSYIFKIFIEDIEKDDTGDDAGSYDIWAEPVAKPILVE